MNLNENYFLKRKNMMMKYKDCIIDLANAPGDIVTANSLIKRFKKKNCVEFDLKINIDYAMKDYGIYEDGVPGEISVNPALAIVDNKDSKDLNSYRGYTIDWTLLGVTMHEFGHYLCCELYEGIIEEYTKEFPKNRLFLGEYSNENVDEELAEIIRLYMLNPLLLKLVGGDVYKYIKSWFDSPNPSSQKFTVYLVEKFPVFIKEDLKQTWNLVHDIHLNKIVKVVSNGRK